MIVARGLLLGEWLKFLKCQYLGKGPWSSKKRNFISRFGREQFFQRVKGQTLTPKEVIAFCRSANVKAIDLRFVDFLGHWGHTTIPVSALSESIFENGLGFDGSSVRGWQQVDESDMLLIPRP